LVLVRDVIDDELEQAFSGKKSGPHLIPPSSAATGCCVSSSGRIRIGSEVIARPCPTKGRPEYLLFY
jgi:hypothetical protein